MRVVQSVPEHDDPLPAADMLFCPAPSAAVLLRSAPGVWKEEDMMVKPAGRGLPRLLVVAALLPVMLALVHAEPVEGA